VSADGNGGISGHPRIEFYVHLVRPLLLPLTVVDLVVDVVVVVGVVFYVVVVVGGGGVVDPRRRYWN